MNIFTGVFLYMLLGGLILGEGANLCENRKEPLDVNDLELTTILFWPTYLGIAFIVNEDVIKNNCKIED